MSNDAVCSMAFVRIHDQWRRKNSIKAIVEDAGTCKFIDACGCEGFIFYMGILERNCLKETKDLRLIAGLRLDAYNTVVLLLGDVNTGAAKGCRAKMHPVCKTKQHGEHERIAVPLEKMHQSLSKNLNHIVMNIARRLNSA